MPFWSPAAGSIPIPFTPIKAMSFASFPPCDPAESRLDPAPAGRRHYWHFCGADGFEDWALSPEERDALLPLYAAAGPYSVEHVIEDD